MLNRAQLTTNRYLNFSTCLFGIFFYESGSLYQLKERGTSIIIVYQPMTDDNGDDGNGVSNGENDNGMPTGPDFRSILAAAAAINDKEERNWRAAINKEEDKEERN